MSSFMTALVASLGLFSRGKKAPEVKPEKDGAFIRCPACKKVLHSTIPRCPYCSAFLEVKCPNCDRTTNRSLPQCPFCGTSLEGAR